MSRVGKVGLAFNLKQDCPQSGETEDAAAEYESPETVETITHALEKAGYHVVPLPFRDDLFSCLQREKPQIVFNIAEGWTGRNRESLLPAIFDFMGIPYTGSDPLTLGLALDKGLTKTVAAAAGVATPRFRVAWGVGDLENLDLDFPLFVKPAYEGSSKGIRDSSRVDTPEDLTRLVSWITGTYRQPALVEEFLPGREFTVGILGNSDLKVLPIMEVRPGAELADSLGNKDFVYSFETKSRNMEYFLCPAPLPEEMAERIRRMAMEVYRVLECRDLSRIDIRLDAAGNPHFLEINPLPGLSRVSLFPLLAKTGGIEFEELVPMILRLAMERCGLA